jgi:predicted glycosyltransferase
MRRTSSIAARLLEIEREASVLTLADSPLGRFFEAAANHDYLKLPSIVKTRPGEWRSSALPLAFDEVLTMRKELIWAAVSTFRPDVLLVDHMPHGAMGELLPTLQRLRDTHAKTRVVLGLRDILDAPSVVKERWTQEGAYEAIERYYNMVLVYGERDVFDMIKEYGFHAAEARFRYCGYVCTPETARYSSKIRAEQLAHAKPGARLIVAMAGGGADAYPMMRALLGALPSILEHQSATLVLITGPFMPANLRRHLQALAHGLPARVRITVSDSLSYLEAADLVVAMAGYNTTMEILRSGKPALLIPRAGPSAEQRMRATLFAERGWVRMLDPLDLEAGTVATAVLDSLDSGLWTRDFGLSGPTRQPDLRGLEIAVEHILSLTSPLPLTVTAATAQRGTRQARQPSTLNSSRSPNGNGHSR